MVEAFLHHEVVMIESLILEQSLVVPSGKLDIDSVVLIAMIDQHWCLLFHLNINTTPINMCQMNATQRKDTPKYALSILKKCRQGDRNTLRVTSNHDFFRVPKQFNFPLNQLINAENRGLQVLLIIPFSEARFVQIFRVLLYQVVEPGVALPVVAGAVALRSGGEDDFAPVRDLYEFFMIWFLEGFCVVGGAAA